MRLEGMIWCCDAESLFAGILAGCLLAWLTQLDRKGFLFLVGMQPSPPVDSNCRTLNTLDLIHALALTGTYQPF